MEKEILMEICSNCYARYELGRESKTADAFEHLKEKYGFEELDNLDDMCLTECCDHFRAGFVAGLDVGLKAVRRILWG